MAETSARDNIGDVDFVFTWVDGSDPEHCKLRKQCLDQVRSGGIIVNTHHHSSFSTCRWRNSGEICEAIKSVLTYAPWVRHIYVVCSHGQTPPEMITKKEANKHKILIVQDSVICPSQALPVFNSHAIEANLHKIPGLSERFVYMCDDMFLGTPITKTFFFDQLTGKAKIFLGKALTTNSAINTHTSSRYPAWYSARINNRKLLDSVYGKKIRQDMIHQAKALNKTAMIKAWSNPMLASKLQQTCMSKFRSSTDTEPIGLYCWVGIETGQCVGISAAITAHIIRNKYFDINDHCDFRAISKELISKNPRLYCLNDTMINPSEMHLKTYRNFLQNSLPHNHK